MAYVEQDLFAQQHADKKKEAMNSIGLTDFDRSYAKKVLEYDSDQIILVSIFDKEKQSHLCF